MKLKRSSEKQLKSEEIKRVMLALQRFFLFVILPPFIVIPIVNFTFTNPSEHDLKNRVRSAFSTGNPRIAKQTLLRLIKEEPNNPTHHYWYIRTHFELPESTRDDNAIYKEYHQRAYNGDPNISDIGYLGLGLYHINKKSYHKVITSLDNVTNRKLKYVNYLTGIAHEKLENYEQAEISFQKEIEFKGYVSSSVYRLARMFEQQKNNEALNRLYENPETKKFIPNTILRKLYLQKLRIGTYFLSLIAPIKKNINLIGFLGAVFIVFVWLYFLKRIDLFEPEKSKFIILTFAISMVLTIFLVGFLYDVFEFYLNLDLTDTWMGDLLYCIFGIGFIEEFVKLIPLLLMIRFTKEVNESIDFIVYASVSALGFSFMENLLYFSESSLFIIDERGMICSIGHMFYTSLIGYGIILAKYKKKGSVVVNGLLFFIIACVFHGIYDFWLISDSIPKEFRLFSFILVLVEVVLFNKIINNALNLSEFFNEALLHKLNHMRERLGFALMLTVLFEYICLSWKYGPKLTFARFDKVTGFTAFLIFFLSFNLTHYVIKKKRWVSLFSKRSKGIEQGEGFIPS